MRPSLHGRSPASSFLLRLSGLGAALACLPAGAQNIPPADAWQFEFVPYLWTAGVRSDLKLGPLPTDAVSVSATSLLKALKFGAMGTLEARKGDWGAFLDMQYIKLGVTNQVAGGLLVNNDIDLTQQFYTMAGTYRVYNGRVAVDVLGGARYAYVKTEVNALPTLRGPGRQIEQSGDAWNGILGVRALMPLNDKWSLLGYLDAGEGSSTSSWQAVAGASYQYSPAVSLKFGYRYLSYKFDDGLLTKNAMGGPYFGAGFKF
ncbi:hypothetical protein [Variovorax saccharolyticus]|uniref:hypothetical protein n=1 Tax=Variovorax saccharolyticus TaxID=3053516 RepID=UPI00257867C6|nr:MULTISPECIES: hypothetical protein [unclassified Variovorax]MDM0019356.1 hypothetical protein [Variovorax sp. J22R187]MDM0026227.1 hypothetical protein [Variovorax sp. J31P216]